MTRQPSPYEAYEALVSPARPTSELWRLVAGVFGCVALYLVGAQIYFSVVMSLATVTDASSPAMALLFLLQFGILLIALTFILNTLHHRSITTVLGPSRVGRAYFVRCLLAVLALHVAISVLPPYDSDQMLPNPNMNLGRWLVLLPLSLPAVLLQSATEEAFFRGYVQSQLAARFSSPIVWMIVPSVLFALLHVNPDHGSATPYVVIWALAFGLISADITARTGSLAPAIALHFMNNAMGILIIGYPDDYGALALYHVPQSISDLGSDPIMIGTEFLVLISSWLVVRIALRH